MGYLLVWLKLSFVRRDTDRVAHTSPARERRPFWFLTFAGSVPFPEKTTGRFSGIAEHDRADALAGKGRREQIRLPRVYQLKAIESSRRSEQLQEYGIERQAR